MCSEVIVVLVHNFLLKTSRFINNWRH